MQMKPPLLLFCRVTMDTILFTQLLVGTWCMQAYNVKWTFYPVII